MNLTLHRAVTDDACLSSTPIDAQLLHETPHGAINIGVAVNGRPAHRHCLRQNRPALVNDPLA